MKNEIINLVERFKSFLMSETEKPVELSVEEKEIEAEYVIEGTEDKVIVYKDGTIGGVELEPNKEYILEGNQVLVTDEDGKVKEIKVLEIPEEEKPVETDVTLSESTMSEYDATLSDEQIETLEEQADGDKDELIKSLMIEIEVLTVTNKELEAKVDELETKIAEYETELSCVKKKKEELESQIPTVVAGVEIKQSETAKEENTKLSLNELLIKNFQ